MLFFSTVADAPNCAGLKKIYLVWFPVLEERSVPPIKYVICNPDFGKGACSLCVLRSCLGHTSSWPQGLTVDGNAPGYICKTARVGVDAED